MTVLVVHAAVTLCLVGLIWFVQVVHYPLLARLGPAGFVEHEVFHVQRTTYIVAPLMLAEVVTASWLGVDPPSPEALPLTIGGFVLLLVVWLSTALLQVPCHRRLEQGFDRAVAVRLVRTNWLRTAAWTLRGVIALALLEAAA